MGAGRPAAASQTATHVIDTSTSSSTAREIATARRADSVAFLHRAPFALDAYELGFLPGFREDCGYQQSQSTQLDIPVGMLDNDFRNPDLERFVDRFFEHEPQVGVIGDVYERDDINDHVAAAREIQASYPEAELIIVPKSRTVIDAIPEDLVLGYSRGYADRLAHEFSDPPDWRGRRIHILGGSPPKQLEAIRQLTRPTLSADPPADIVGVDWNGLHRGAQFGEFWTTDGWDDSGRDADHVTVWRTVRHSLARIREFWKVHGIWPETTPQDEGIHIEYGGRPQPISNRPLALNVGRTSGEHLAARTSLNTGPAQSVGTVVTSATSPIAIGITTRRSLASRASTSRRRKQRAVFRAPGGAEARS
ncbi:hypothetical protein Hlac_2842 [Halorubrum lacusprofundi ATCC 49239]|jgi:hypothetical protein|uniref:Uncharacterized protein n=2 Tax=Halorubrum lacusprofundi TaxID=2247 RepID=B9LW16_HALLT|nr:hypothetical protein Hlac_2842 [Halorubrum lacusprofundi ATCC 49239]AEN07699.1 hypothetical protein Halar_0450 [halophilic archaeon DL31]